MTFFSNAEYILCRSNYSRVRIVRKLFEPQSVVLVTIRQIQLKFGDVIVVDMNCAMHV
jgi:hypothetical protein